MRLHLMKIDLLPKFERETLKTPSNHAQGWESSIVDSDQIVGKETGEHLFFQSKNVLEKSLTASNKCPHIHFDTLRVGEEDELQ